MSDVLFDDAQMTISFKNASDIYLNDLREAGAQMATKYLYEKTNLILRSLCHRG